MEDRNYLERIAKLEQDLQDSERQIMKLQGLLVFFALLCTGLIAFILFFR